ncbi:MAG: tetratricopeptide repeat protein [Deltaproteobacteria bacterium]|nr:tetratricopeptide repeat protein [Deltaproteobacteria bacterium]
MDPQRWRQIEDIFHQAAALEPAARARYITEAAGGDEDLRREVESLLISSSASDDPVVEVVGKTLREVAFEGTLQQTFGPYRASRWLGGGNHSDVYLAERTDGEYHAEVAIKVAKRGFPTEDLRRRFRQERQILASLEHPHIARILDGGTTGDGLPFFVMEFVDGEPIDEYCDHRKLSIRKRLELFRSVCSAVEHAHRNLTIHRDLKPSNILVAEGGRPILLDFGIAKLLQPPTTLDQALRTQEGVQMLTPAFASPEQVLGKPLSTSTDVYSLGVVLYDLLCGRPPYELEGLEPKALYETVCESQPAEPSRALRRRDRAQGTPQGSAQSRVGAVAEARGETVNGLQQRLQGDLDTIALMALRKEPERRYASVAALSEDIGLYLRHRPIRARKETLSYRSSKLLRRHPYGAATTAALLLAVLVGVLSTMRATSLAQAQRDQAQISEAEAERVTDFMVGLFEVSSPEISLGEEVSALEILDRGAKLIEDELDEQPLSRARLLRAMGRAYHGLGLFPRAQTLLEQASQDREKILGSSHEEVAAGLVDLAKPILAAGDYAQAQQVIEESLEIYRRSTSTSSSRVDLGKAEALNVLGEIRTGQGDVAQAEDLYRQALDLRASRLGLDHLDSLESLNDLAETLFTGGRFEEAESLFGQVLAGRKRRLSEAHPKTIETLNNIAVVQQAQENFQGAEVTMREVIEDRRRLYGNDHPHVILSYSNLAQILSSQGKFQEAVGWAEQALDLGIQLHQQDHPRIADLLHSLGGILMDLDRLEDAQRRLSEALEIRRRSLGEGHPYVAQSLISLAALHQRLGQMDLAFQETRQSLQILATALPEGDFRNSYPQLQMGLLLSEAGRCEEAIPYFDQALESRSTVYPEGHEALEEILEGSRLCRQTVASSS